MPNEFRVRRGLIVNGSGSTILDVQGSQGQLFSVTDSLSGSLFAVKDISGMPVIEAFSNDTVRIGTYAAEAIVVTGSTSRVTGSFTGSLTGTLIGTSSWATSALTASLFITSSVTSASFASTASFFITGSVTSASFAATASSADAFNVRTSATASNLLVTNTITAQTLVVQTITASVEYSSGSNIFGSRQTDVQQFTGSVNITGSLRLTGQANLTGVTSSLFGTSSWAVNAATASLFITSSVTSASFASTASFVNLALTASNFFTSSVTSASFSSTASFALNAFPFTGSARITGSLDIVGTTTITGSLNVTQSSISSVDWIDFTVNAATPPHVEGRIHWDVDRKTLQVDTDVNNFMIPTGHANVLRGRNTNSYTLTKGTVVYINGNSGQFATFGTASWENDPNSAYTIGLIGQDIAPNNFGYAVTNGEITGINTNAYSPATLLYLSSSGQYTDVKPIAPLHAVRLGQVVVQSTSGILQVKVDNGYETDELHDVLLNNTASGDLLVRSGSLWINSKQLTGSYGLTGSMTITGSLNLSTPIYNTSSINVLTINTSSNAVEYSTINDLTFTKNIVTVGLSGSRGVRYNVIKNAVDSITDAAQNNTYTVRVSPGLYIEDTITVPSWVAIKGDSSISTVVSASNPSQSIFIMSDQSMVIDMQVQGSTAPTASAIVYSSATTPQTNAIAYVENVRFGTNYTNAKVIGSGSSGNCILQCSNVKYGGFTDSSQKSFDVGFHVTSGSSGGIGRMQLRNVTSTNGGVAGTDNNQIFALADAPGCTFIVNGCLLTRATGTARGTAFKVYNGGQLRLTGVNFQRWINGIWAPQTGSAPSIDAVALNFENCTNDVLVEHTGSTGKVQGTDNFLKTIIPYEAPLYEVGQDQRKITVAKKGGDFTSISASVAYITDSSETNRYVIEVGPGEFTEKTIDLRNKPYISIVGSDIQSTHIMPSGSGDFDQFILGNTNEVSFLSLMGSSTPGYAAFTAQDLDGFALLHKVSIYDWDYGIKVISNASSSQVFGEYIDINGPFTYGVYASSSNGVTTLANMENYYLFPSGAVSIGNYAIGSGTEIDIYSSVFTGNSVSGSAAIYLADGAVLESAAVDIQDWEYGLQVPNIGSAPRFRIVGAMIHDSITYDFYVQKTGTQGRFQGISDHSKISNVSEDFYWNFLDDADGENDVTRKLSVTFADGTHTDATTLIFKGSPMGVMSGGTITVSSGLTITTSAGFGYCEDPLDAGVYKRIDWNNSNITLSANTNNYIYINYNGVLSASGTAPSSTTNIILGRVVTNNTTVEIIDQSPYDGAHMSNKISKFNRDALGPVYADGSIVTENVTPFRLDVTQGSYFFSENNFTPSGGTAIAIGQYYPSASTWNTSSIVTIPNNQYASGSSLIAMSSSYYTKHTLYVVGDGVNEKYFLVVNSNQYATLVETENADLPAPPTYFNDGVVSLASVYVQSGSANITQIQDIRPIIGFRAAGVNASSVHGNLLGLSADDHTQYLLVNGGRQMSGDLGLGGNDLYNFSSVSGSSITASGASITDIKATSITGSLLGTATNALTASYVLQAVSSSYAVTASHLLGQVLSASFASTASYVETARTASFFITSSVTSASFAATASFFITSSVTSASFASTASYVETARTASFFITSSVTSASFASTASYVENARTASFFITSSVTSASFAATASLFITSSVTSASFARTASYVETARTASFFITSSVTSASFASTASYVETARTASFFITSSVTSASFASTASYVEIARTASFFITSSVTSASFASTASYVETARTASFFITSSVTSASFASTASFFITSSVTSASFASTASYVETARTASFFITSSVTSASFSSTASYVETARTASFFITSSVTSASFATSASRAESAGNSSTIDINVFGSDVESYLLMSNVAGTTGVAIGSDAELRYNANTNRLTVGTISATSLTGSLIGTASWAQNSLTASFFITSSVTSASFASTASYVETARTASFFITSSVTSASFAATASFFITSSVTSASFSSTASYVENARTASFFITSSVTSASFAATASSADTFNVRTSATASNLLVTNTITAQTLVVQTVTSSITYSSGSNIFGNKQTDVQQITGSLSVTGSLIVVGQANITGITSSLFGTSSWAINAATASLFITSSVTSASFASTASYVETARTASYFITSSVTSASFSSTASYVENARTASFFITSSVTSASFASTASYVETARTASFFITSSVTSASFAATASSVNTLNQSVLITGSLTVGANSLGSAENTLILGPKSTNEGGQLLLQSPTSASYTSASMLDIYADTSTNSQFIRILRGSNAGSDAIVSQFNLHTKQFLLPSYNSLGAFSGTAVAALGVDSTGAVITIQTGSQAGGGGVTINNNTNNYILTATGTTNTINGESNLQFDGSTLSVTGNVSATSITSSGAIISQANNAMYFRGGDDAELWDINVANTVAIYGQQDQTIGAIKLGSGGGTLTGKSGNIGIGTIDPTQGTLEVNGNVYAISFTGSLFGTSSWAQNARTASFFITSSVTSASFASTASYVENARTASFFITSSVTSASFASTASYVENARTASFFITSSVTSASFASTASYVENARTASFFITSSVTSASFSSTASYVENARTASFFITSSVTSASFASTASYVENARTASFFITSSVTSASFASTASYVENARTASFFITSSVTSASFASTASYVETARTASFFITSSVTSASFASTASFVNTALTASFFITSSVTSASFASTASYVENARTASYFITSSVTSASFASSGSNFVISNTLRFADAFMDTSTIASSIVGSNNLFTLDTGSATSAVFQYTVSNAGNTRTGMVLSGWNGTTVTYTDVSSPAIGDTLDVTFAIAIVSSQMQFNATTATSGWRLKAMVTLI